MANYLLGFPNKKERDDFLIAIVVILFFISLFWFFMGRGDGPKMDINQVPTAQIVADEVDSDLDGILDADDACPNLAGVSDNNGCPADRDSDGIYDKDDMCPQLAGISDNNGCPADTDNDGVYDIDDACPKIPGNSDSGCPPDSDGDGVFDHLDKCPNQKGTKENMGCPFTPKDAAAIRNIQSSVEFETGRAILTKSSLAKLDELVKLLRKYPSVKMKIEGYTDSAGDAAKNLNLSKNRALACKTYLEDKGISSARLRSAGYGEARPVATNTTEEGKSKNRRVEFNSF
jgi:outer membrane protein OmpA-like peptidoglycan-associated protein